jgi:MFS-type transporter involved in bile tolerance (Atg22 family)
VAVLVALATLDVSGPSVWMLFLAYAASLAIAEPAERALVGDCAPTAIRGTTFGLYHLVSGLFALPGAFLFGAIWQYVSSTAAFLSAALVTAGAACLLLIFSRRHFL